MASAYALGIGNALAAAQEKSSATQQGAIDATHEQQDSGMDDITSAPIAGNCDKGGMSDMSWNEYRGSGRIEKPVASGDAGGAFHADDLSGKDVILAGHLRVLP